MHTVFNGAESIKQSDIGRRSTNQKSDVSRELLRENSLTKTYLPVAYVSRPNPYSIGIHVFFRSILKEPGDK